MIVCNVHLRKKHLQSYFFSYKMRDSYGGWVAQLVEQRIENPRVGGSIPCGWVAQLVEQRIENPRVGGSIPSPATSKSSRVVLTTRDFL